MSETSKPSLTIEQQPGDAGTTIHCFGEVRATVDNQTVRLSKPQALAVSLLVVAGDQGLSADELLDQLYDEPPKSGKQAVVMAVRRLRKKLPGDMIVTGGRYAINANACDVDVWTFADLASDDPIAAIRQWQEPFLGVDDKDFVLSTERERLRQIRHRALIAAGRYIDDGHAEDVLSELLAELNTSPDDEALAISAAAATYRLGRQAEAIELIQQCRNRLAERGLDPTSKLRDVECAILTHDDSPLAARVDEAAPTNPIREPELPTAFGEPPDRIVGRDDALRSLRDVYDIVASGDGVPGRGTIVLRGNGGAGKTACAASMVQEFAASGARVRVGMADEDETPFGPILRALPELVPTIEALAPNDPGAERVTIDRAAAAIVEVLCEQTPLVLVLDDAHLADNQSLELMRSLATGVLSRRVLTVFTCRHDRANVGWATTLDYFVEIGGRVVDLEPLTLDDIEEMVTGDHPEQKPMIQHAFAQRLHELSEGNGFVASVLSRDAPPDLNTLLLPEPLNAHDSLAAHLRRKIDDPFLEDVLTAASLIGQRFPVALVAHVVNESVHTIEAALERCGQLGICRLHAEGTWQFDHLLSVNYFTSRAPLLRQLLFSRIAQHRLAPLESMPRYIAGAGETVTAEFAYEALMRSGRMRFDSLAFYDALRTFSQALAFVADAEGDELELRLLLAQCASRCAALDEARGHREKAFVLAKANDDHDAMCDAALAGLPAGEFAGGEPDRLQMLREVDAARLARFSRVTVARHLLRQGRLCQPTARVSDVIDEAEQVLDEAQRRSTTLGIPATRMSTEEIALEIERLVAISLSQEPSPVHHELSALAERLELGPLRAQIRQREVLTALLAQESTATTNRFQRAAGEVHAHGSARTRWSMDILEAALNLTGTRPSTTNVDTARRSGLRLGIPDVHDNWHVQLWMTAWVNELFREALDSLDAARDQIADNLAWRAAEALCAAQVDDLARARREVDRICEELPQASEGHWSLTVAALLSESAHLLGDEDAAEIAMNVLLPHAGRAVVLGAGSAYFGPVDRYLGLAAYVIDRESAERYFHAALAPNRAPTTDVFTMRTEQALRELF